MIKGCQLKSVHHHLSLGQDAYLNIKKTIILQALQSVQSVQSFLLFFFSCTTNFQNPSVPFHRRKTTKSRSHKSWANYLLPSPMWVQTSPRCARNSSSLQVCLSIHVRHCHLGHRLFHLITLGCQFRVAGFGRYLSREKSWWFWNQNPPNPPVELYMENPVSNQLR